MEKIARRLCGDGFIPVALDVACGTGLSSVALMDVASRVVGVDSSPEMLSLAPLSERIEYIEASAEKLPFDADSFDLVTVSSAFHWLDRSRFLSEACRVLRTSGWLVIYDNCFSGRMEDNADFESWFRDCYLTLYPAPSRNNTPLTESEVAESGLRFALREEYTNYLTCTVEGLASYLETQSNVTAALENGKENIEVIRKWLHDSLAPHFSHPSGIFEFGGYIWYLDPLPLGEER